MINISRRRDLAAGLAMHTQRMLGDEASAGLLPLVAVPASARGFAGLLADIALGLLCMRIAVAVGIAMQRAAARGSTWSLWSHWHGVPSK